jgi:hypothetical protein
MRKQQFNFLFWLTAAAVVGQMVGQTLPKSKFNSLISIQIRN